MPMIGSFARSFFPARRPGIISSPDVLPDLQVWYNADIGAPPNFNQTLASGDPISQWLDRSGTGHNANQTGSASLKPKWIANVQNGLGVIRFDGVDEKLDINPIAWTHNLPGFTMLIAARNGSTSGARTLVSNNNGNLKISFNGSAWAVSQSGGTGVSSVVGDTSNFHIFGSVFDGTATGNDNRLKFIYDGGFQPLAFSGTVGTATGATATTLYLGSDETGASSWLNGDIAEVLMFTRTLTDGEIDQAVAYLQAHWNI